MRLAIPSFLLRSNGWSGRLTGFAIGGFCVLGQAPFHLWGFSLLGFALFYLRLRDIQDANKPLKSGFWSAFWFGLGYFGVSVFWMGSAFIARGPEFIPVMPPMVFGLAALLSLFWALAGAAFVKAKLIDKWAPAGFVSLYMVAEFARGHAFGGLPWNLPGYIFPAGSLPSQAASVGTIYGLTFIFFIVAVALAHIFISRNKVVPALISAALIASLYGFGAYRLSDSELEFQENVKLRIVAVPFDQADKFHPDKSIDIVNQFIMESVQDTIPSQGYEGPLKDITHIIWPEGAVSGLAMDNEYLLGVMGYGLAARLDSNLPVWLFNSLRLEQRPNPNGGTPIDDYYNSSVAVTFDDKGIPAVASYNDKARLVPFGEFIPFGKFMEMKNVPVISTSLLSISPAKQKTLATFPGLPIGSPQICYEVVFPGFTPKGEPEAKAEFILNQSNDAWFGKSWGPAQHANIARYRAIEEGLPLIRAASNGETAIIDPYGRILIAADKTQVSHIDSALPRPLEMKRDVNSKQIILFLFLINLAISLLCAALGRARQKAAII